MTQSRGIWQRPRILLLSKHQDTLVNMFILKSHIGALLVVGRQDKHQILEPMNRVANLFAVYCGGKNIPILNYVNHQYIVQGNFRLINHLRSVLHIWFVQILRLHQAARPQAMKRIVSYSTHTCVLFHMTMGSCSGCEYHYTIQKSQWCQLISRSMFNPKAVCVVK